MITIPLTNPIGMIIVAGAVSVALVTLYRTWIRPTQRFFRDLGKVLRDNLSINGSDQLLPPEWQGIGTRALLIRHIVTQQATELSLHAAIASLGAPLQIDPAVAATAATSAATVLEAASSRAASVLESAMNRAADRLERAAAVAEQHTRETQADRTATKE